MTNQQIQYLKDHLSDLIIYDIIFWSAKIGNNVNSDEFHSLFNTIRETVAGELDYVAGEENG